VGPVLGQSYPNQPQKSRKNLKMPTELS